VDGALLLLPLTSQKSKRKRKKKRGSEFYCHFPYKMTQSIRRRRGRGLFGQKWDNSFPVRAQILGKSNYQFLLHYYFWRALNPVSGSRVRVARYATHF
jgi:hypothetical protein